jgi:hypothetical protein
MTVPGSMNERGLMNDPGLMTILGEINNNFDPEGIKENSRSSRSTATD